MPPYFPIIFIKLPDQDEFLLPGNHFMLYNHVLLYA